VIDQNHACSGLRAACTSLEAADLLAILPLTKPPLFDAHQETTVEGLYAAGDIVSDLHQLAVATAHAAVATTAIHNRLDRNLR
jgi:thioredoxin reductase